MATQPLQVISVFGLRSSTTRDQINQLFAQQGKIENIFMIMDRMKSKNDAIFKGYCYITYSTPEEAALAVSVRHGSIVNGRQVHVELARTQPH